MAGECVVTVYGNLTGDVELRSTQNGRAVANFTVAQTERSFNRQSNQWEDGNTVFMRCSAWGDMAQHCAQSLAKGMRVIAQGRLQQSSYQANDGSKRTVIELRVDEVGPSLRYATAQVTRQQKQQYQPGSQPPQPPQNFGGQTYQPQPQNFQQPQQQYSQPPADPWSNGGNGGFDGGSI